MLSKDVRQVDPVATFLYDSTVYSPGGLGAPAKLVTSTGLRDNTGISNAAVLIRRDSPAIIPSPKL